MRKTGGDRGWGKVRNKGNIVEGIKKYVCV
jgi:hypothetical protein